MARRPMAPAPQFHSASLSPLLGKEGVGETYKEGAVLVVDTAQLDEGGANPTNIVGISGAPASGTTGADMPYYPALPSAIFEANLDKASALGYVSLATDLFAEYGITEDASGFWYIDVDKTAGNARVRVVGFRDPIGTVSGRVYCVFSADVTLYEAS